MSYDEHLISMAGGDGELDLDQIQARADAASKPPWRLANPRPDGRNMVERHGYDLYGGEVAEMIIVDTNPADAEFIAHARTDVPALLAVVRSQQAKIERAEVIVSEYMADYNSGIEIHHADLARLRAALTATEGAA